MSWGWYGLAVELGNSLYPLDVDLREYPVWTVDTG
jgi:hypothetical protein